MPVEVTDPADPRLADFVGLTDVARRSAHEPAAGFFLAEGELVVRRAVELGYRLRALLVLDRFAPAVAALAGDAPVYVGRRDVLHAVTGFDVHRGILASVVRPPARSADEVLTSARRVAVLEDMNNSTNVGAVFRAAAGLGIDAVLLTPLCADPLYRRAVRVSMGASLALPYARLTPWPAALRHLSEAGFDSWALTPAADAVPIGEAAATAGERVALLLGAEGPGLSAGALTAAARRVRIPMARGTDSLNVAAAAAVAFYAVSC